MDMYILVCDVKLFWIYMTWSIYIVFFFLPVYLECGLEIFVCALLEPQDLKNMMFVGPMSPHLAQNCIHVFSDSAMCAKYVILPNLQRLWWKGGGDFVMSIPQDVRLESPQHLQLDQPRIWKCILFWNYAGCTQSQNPPRTSLLSLPFQLCMLPMLVNGI